MEYSIHLEKFKINGVIILKIYCDEGFSDENPCYFFRVLYKNLRKSVRTEGGIFRIPNRVPEFHAIGFYKSSGVIESLLNTNERVIGDYVFVYPKSWEHKIKGYLTKSLVIKFESMELK